MVARTRYRLSCTRRIEPDPRTRSARPHRSAAHREPVASRDRHLAARGSVAVQPRRATAFRGQPHRVARRPRGCLPGAQRRARPLHRRPAVVAIHRPVRARRADAIVRDDRRTRRDAGRRAAAGDAPRRRLDRRRRQPGAFDVDDGRGRRHHARVPLRRRPATGALAVDRALRRTHGAPRRTAVAKPRRLAARHPGGGPSRRRRRLVVRVGGERDRVDRIAPGPRRRSGCGSSPTSVPKSRAIRSRRWPARRSRACCSTTWRWCRRPAGTRSAPGLAAHPARWRRRSGDRRTRQPDRRRPRRARPVPPARVGVRRDRARHRQLVVVRAETGRRAASRSPRASRDHAQSCALLAGAGLAGAVGAARAPTCARCGAARPTSRSRLAAGHESRLRVTLFAALATLLGSLSLLPIYDTYRLAATGRW